MPRPARQAVASEIRHLRRRLRLSQPRFAALLGVSPETYRTWDCGRRPVPATWLGRARALALTHDPDGQRPLRDLATERGEFRSDFAVIDMSTLQRWRAVLVG